MRRDDFATKHPIDKLVAMKIAFHERRLFGWRNQLLLLKRLVLRRVAPVKTCLGLA